MLFEEGFLSFRFSDVKSYVIEGDPYVFVRSDGSVYIHHFTDRCFLSNEVFFDWNSLEPIEAIYRTGNREFLVLSKLGTVSKIGGGVKNEIGIQINPGDVPGAFFTSQSQLQVGDSIINLPSCVQSTVKT